MSSPANTLPREIAKSSIYVAAGRAVGAREPDPAVRNPDSLAERLLDDPSALQLDVPIVRALSLPYDEAMKDLEVIQQVRMMMIRTRFIDDLLMRAIADGATQVVVLGAGFDSHAYRCRDLLRQARIFEVDRPSTQSFKKQRVQDVLGLPPQNLTYVSTDFEHEDLGTILRRNGCDPTQRTFFILEGVTMYLAEEALRRTLRVVSSYPPGSGLVFDFVYRSMIDALARFEPTHVPEQVQVHVQHLLELIKDEPWLFGFPAWREREFLSAMGFDLRESLTVGSEESIRRYLTKSDGTRVGAQAIAEAKTSPAARSGPSGAEVSQDHLRGQGVGVYRLAAAVVV
jgi:methyltransferase (TIGR00027 family)